MDPLTLVVVLLAVWFLASGSGPPPSYAIDRNGRMADQWTQTLPGGTNSPLAVHGAVDAQCPPGTQWNGQGCTEPPHHSTDATAQPLGADSTEKPLVPLRVHPETYGVYPGSGSSAPVASGSAAPPIASGTGVPAPPRIIRALKPGAPKGFA